LLVIYSKIYASLGLLRQESLARHSCMIKDEKFREEVGTNNKTGSGKRKSTLSTTN